MKFGGINLPMDPPKENDETLCQEDECENYEGERDHRGQRHGIGRCNWDDGSFYEGEWKEGLRHGLGVFILTEINGDKTEYRGQWQADQRHGKARLTLPDQTIIHGDFRNDKLEGLATYEQKDLPLYFVMFKNGMMVVLDNNTFNWRLYMYVLFSLAALAVVVFAGPFILYYPQYTFGCSRLCTSPTHIGTSFFALYPIYLFYSCCLDSTKFLKNC